MTFCNIKQTYGGVHEIWYYHECEDASCGVMSPHGLVGGYQRFQGKYCLYLPSEDRGSETLDNPKKWP
jgi:hypothetical protein